MTKMMILLAGLALPASALAQTGALVSNAPDAAAPADEGGKAADRGGLAGRGGRALDSRRTLQGNVRSEIYTPIYSPIFTPVQTATDSNQPQ